MSDNKKPNIRFKGYSDDWEQRKLDDVVEFLDTMRKPLEGAKRIPGPYPYYGASGIVDYVDGYLFDEELILLSEDGANITDRNYPVCFLASGKYWVNNHAHVLRTKQENENNFICNSLEREDYTQYNTGMAMPKLNKETCKKIPISCPGFEEQKKIGDYFRSLDHLITLHQRKYDKLQTLKKAMLEKMFPKNGSNVPEIRFKGFTDAWEQRKVGELIKDGIIDAPLDGNHGEKHPTASEYVDSGIPFLMASDVHGGIADIKSCKFITRESAERLDKGFAKNGDVLLTHKATIGESAILQGLETEYAVLTPQVTYYRIQDEKKLSREYLYAFFNSVKFQNDLKTKAAQSTRPYIGISAQQNLDIVLPRKLTEQKKIGVYFSDLDHLITLHQRELEKLQNIKKAMLEKMFV